MLFGMGVNYSLVNNYCQGMWNFTGENITLVVDL